MAKMEAYDHTNLREMVGNMKTQTDSLISSQERLEALMDAGGKSARSRTPDGRVSRRAE
jgi:hypothetical protein